VTFFLTSKLPEDLLAHIWDLADIPKRGVLTRDTFAVAMYLIRNKVAGKDLPAALPASLIPPSLRHSVPAPPPAPPVLQQPQPSSAAQDLFGLDDAFTSTQDQGTPAPAFLTGLASPTRTMSPTVIPSSPKPSSPILSTPSYRPFQPTSSFGKSISTQNEQVTSTPAPQVTSSSLLPPPAPVQVPMQSGSVFGDGDLLGDADPEISQKLTAETTELANLSNQIGSLNTATRDLQSNKSKAETELATVSQQKRDIEARLKQIRTLYDEEVKNVRDVEAKLATVRAEVGKNRQEITVLEASLHALQAQSADQRNALQRDQSENTALKNRIVSVGEEIKGLKDTLEKVKREARQQRGMVAINKKQLSTMEGERDRISGEIDTEKKSIEQMQAEAAAAREREVASPTLSERSQGTNPFLRMQSPPPESFPSPSVFASSPPQAFSPFDSRFNNAFGMPFGVVAPESITAPQKAETDSQHGSRETTEEPPPSIASAFSPPLQARELSNQYPESVTSSLAVNPPYSTGASVNGETSAHESPDLSSKEVAFGESAATNAPRDGPVIPDIQEKELTGSASETPTPSPNPLQQIVPPTSVPEPKPEPTSPHHGPRSAEAITSPQMVQDVLSHPPRDRELSLPVTSLDQTPIEFKPIPPEEAAKREEPTAIEEEETKGVALPGGFPSEASDEGRESWVDLGDESKSLPSEQPREIAQPLPSNRSDPFAFAATSVPPRAASKEDFDAAFSGFSSFGKKEENGIFKKDFDSEFPPIEEFGGEESDSDDEPGGFHFKDNFAEKSAEPPANTTSVSMAGRSVETPMPQTLPVVPPIETAPRSPPPEMSPDATVPLQQDMAPPVPPKDIFSESSAPPMTPSQTPPPENMDEPPAYTRYSNPAENSAGSNDLRGLIPSRDVPQAVQAPYTSPPPEPIVESPTPFTPAVPVSFSPTLNDNRRYSPPGPLFPTAAPSMSPKLEPRQKPPASMTQSGASSTADIPSIQEPPPKPPKQVQTFAAFDFSGLQDAAPLDETQDDPFRLSTRSDAFGEFDTTFDSAPVTPAKPADPTKAQRDEFSDFGFDIPPEFGAFQTPQPRAQSQSPPTVNQPQQQPDTQSAPLSLSNFDDVFGSFDRPPGLTAPVLPPRNPSPDDDPNLKTLTGMNLRERADYRNGIYSRKSGGSSRKA
jgi:epidermal growth factor receptor substrate 15